MINMKFDMLLKQIKLNILILNFDLDLDSRLHECKKAKIRAAVISQSVSSIWIEFGMLLKLVGLMNAVPILSCLFSIQRREPYLCDFAEKKRTHTFTVGLCQHIYRPISFNLV